MTIKGYIATSADGYIATSDGKVDFLANYQHIDCGYDSFIAEISTIVMGRHTYESILKFDIDWPYPKQQTWVVSSNKNITIAHENIELWVNSLDDLISKLCLPESGNTWIAGGAKLQATFINKGALNELEVYIMPVMLGSGIPLFPKEDISYQTIKQLNASMIDETIIKQTYQFNITEN